MAVLVALWFSFRRATSWSFQLPCRTLSLPHTTLLHTTAATLCHMLAVTLVELNACPHAYTYPRCACVVAGTVTVSLSASVNHGKLGVALWRRVTLSGCLFDWEMGTRMGRTSPGFKYSIKYTDAALLFFFFLLLILIIILHVGPGRYLLAFLKIGCDEIMIVTEFYLQRNAMLSIPNYCLLPPSSSASTPPWYPYYTPTSPWLTLSSSLSWLILIY